MAVEQQPAEGKAAEVDEALYEAALAGNVRAIEIWLQRHQPSQALARPAWHDGLLELGHR